MHICYQQRSHLFHVNLPNKWVNKGVLHPTRHIIKIYETAHNTD